MNKYIGFDMDGKQTQGGNGQIRYPQNRLQLSPLPKFLKQSHQSIRAHWTAHGCPPKTASLSSVCA